jgi:hypothetical protein
MDESEMVERIRALEKLVDYLFNQVGIPNVANVTAKQYKRSVEDDRDMSIRLSWYD